MGSARVWGAVTGPPFTKPDKLTHVSSPTFTQPERRSYLVPILLALVAVVVAIALARLYFPSTSIDTEHIHTGILPTSTTFSSQSTIVGTNRAENVLFIASTIKIENHRRHPIFLDGFKLTFVNPDDAQLTAKGATKADLASIETSFPALTPLVTSPLQIDTSIDPGKSAQGTLIFSLPIPKEMWDGRKVATIQVDIYHDNPVYQDIPKDTPATPAKP
jgi:hypothetical protein